MFKKTAFLLLFIPIKLWAQNGVTLPQYNNSVFLELLGNGGYGSLNYERIITHSGRFSIGISAGAGTFKLSDFNQHLNPDLMVPLSARLYYGRKYKFLLGFGQTYSSVVNLDEKDFTTKRINHLSANFMLGYRLDFKRLSLQLAYTPMIEYYNHYRNWLGFAIGYKF